MVDCAEARPSGTEDLAHGASLKRPREPDNYHLSACVELQRRLELLGESVDQACLELLRLRKSALPPLPPLSALPEQTRARLEASKRGRLAELVTVHCKKVLGGITTHKWCWPFLAPVDLAIYVDYREKVAEPMDFGTIRARLEAGEYTHPDTLAADVRLVFTNARQYNAPGSDVHVMAETLQERFDERYVTYVVPRIADAEAASAREEEEARRETVRDPAREAAAAAAERALLARVEALRAELADAKSLAAASCAPMSAGEKEALCDALGALPQPAFDAAVALVLHRCPRLESAAGVGLDLDALDALTLRQLASFVEAARSGTPPAWPLVPLSGGKLPPESAAPQPAPLATSAPSQTPSPSLAGAGILAADAAKPPSEAPSPALENSLSSAAGEAPPAAPTAEESAVH